MVCEADWLIAGRGQGSIENGSQVTEWVAGWNVVPSIRKGDPGRRAGLVRARQEMQARAQTGDGELFQSLRFL